ncbi:MAG TPA: pyridoxamine 5'-phosphate oxidase family protein [Solirubrobacteraceae bacterium]|jgi:nitroimidazol reductase NimA-like FMN-containing flavoprotein (pyridoxamine 5'-phosphate oxidase superfamily)|nr:pyridoxamine 5'-phosphate oxidase family protein [Solirubrobacteraceae bacterium]
MAQQLPQPVLDYLGSQKTVTLATASADGLPHASTFMYVNDGATLYFWARPSSTTSEHIRSNPRVSFAIDEYVQDWNKAKGIQGDGRCEPVAGGDEMAKAVGLFADKFPSPTSGASTTNIAFHKIEPTALQFIDNDGGAVSLSEDDFGIDFHREDVLASGD